MTAVAVCLIIGLINLLLWAVLFLHFKSKYSSEKILADIADELNKLIRDINKETNNCVTIVKDCRTNLLKLIEESKKYTDLGHESLERKAKSIQVMDALNKETPPPRRRRTSYSDLAPGVGFSRTPIQQDLFEKSPIDEVLKNNEEEYKTEVDIDSVKMQDENEVQEQKSPLEDTALSELTVPEINISEIQLPEITKAQKQVLAEKSLRDRVLELHSEGFSQEVIASRLDVSLIEVQLIVNMYGL
jgi:hypothetical protein